MTYDIYAWKDPREIDGAEAARLVGEWVESGSDPAASPFEPSTDVGWFYRELTKDHPDIEAVSDGPRNTSSRPIWLETETGPPARLVGIRVPPTTPPDVLESIYGLGSKYDLVLFNARSGRLHAPLEEMAAYASATFWPRGAIQAAVAGGGGAIAAVVAWLLGVPIVSGIVVVVGAFMFAMAAYTFIHEGRKRLGRRPEGGETPSS